jgi:hypothetical protein
VDDETGVHNDEQYERTLGPVYTMPGNYNSSAFLSEYLARPVRVAAGVLQATDDASTFTTYAYPSYFMNRPIYLEKLKGFRHFRATGVFTLQVNATKFHAGYYKLCWLPTGGVNSGSPAEIEWNKMHYQTQTQRSQLPGVDLDIALDTSAKLRIPYVSSFNDSVFTATAPGITDFGSVVLCPFSPLAFGAGQDNTVGYTLWFHWEDVNIDMPAFPQSSLTRGKAKKQPSTKEAESKGVGPITSVTRIAAHAFKNMPFVPFLSDIAAPAAWALDLASGVASVFGWSKPTNYDVQHLIQRDFMYGTNHINSVDNSRTLSLDQRNIIEVLPGFSGTDIDELSLDSFLTRPTLLGKFTWSVSSTTGTLLASYAVTPTESLVRVQDGITTIQNTPMSLLSRYFCQWRGDIVYTFHFVKTPMHSGRVCFSFQPAAALGIPGPVALDDTSYTLRRIVDLRETSVVTLVIPYQFYKSYRGLRTDYEINGVLSVQVVDELVAPTTAPQTIEILPWVSAAPGFEFAIPQTTDVRPLTGLAVLATPQSGITPDDYLGGSKSTHDPNYERSRTCIGEKITSLRQMLRVARTLRWSNTYAAAALAPGVTKIHPYYINTVDRIAGVTTESTHSGDMYSMFSSIFAFNRGGLRIKLIAPTLANPARVGLWYEFANGFYQFLNEGGATFPGGSFHNTRQAYCNTNFLYTDPNTRGGFEVTVPNYTPTHTRSNAALICQPTVGAENYGAANNMALCFYDPVGVKAEFLRGGADDFNLGCFVSIPSTLSS